MGNDTPYINILTIYAFKRKYCLEDKMKKYSIVLLACLSSVANAEIIGFDSVTTEFIIAGSNQGNFTVETRGGELGTLRGGYSEDFWRGNGTGRIITWTNTGNVSGFTLHSSYWDLFSLSSFDFGNGYVSGNQPVELLTLTGTLANGDEITQTFANNINGWTTISLSASWVDLQSVDFIANGLNNRAVWDNITVNVPVQAVPTPSVIFLLGSGLISFLGMRRKALK